MSTHTASTHTATGLFDAVQSLAATTLRGAHTRLQLAAVELETERDLLLERVTLLLLALFFAAFGILLGVLWIVMLVDAQYRTAALGSVALVFVLAAAACWWLMRSSAGTRRGFMADTLDVLAEDAQALSGKSFAPQRGARILAEPTDA